VSIRAEGESIVLNFKIAGLFPVVVLILVIASGCSGGDKSQPVIPQTLEGAPPVVNTEAPPDTVQWGTWIIRMSDATEDSPATVSAVPLRSGEVHVNVTGMLKPPKCTNCLDVEIMSIDNLDWTLLVTLTNPTIYTAYDVMGIFPGPEGPGILWPDSYTDLYDVDGDPNTHNPYLIFDTGNENNAWLPIESHSKMITFHREDGQKFTELTYVATASWPDNIAEVAELRNPQVSGPIYTDTSNSVNIGVEVMDWQDDIEYVLVDLTPVNGSAYTHLLSIGDGVWQLYSYTAYGLSPGSATLMIAAKSEGSDFLTYNYVTVQITEAPEPTSHFEILTGPVELTGQGAPAGEMDIAVAGKPDGSSFTFVYASDTQAYFWNTDYSNSSLFITLVDTTGDDPDFPVSPLSRIAVPSPENPLSLDVYSLLQTNNDADIKDDSTDPDILYRNTVQILDLETIQVADFNLTADCGDTPELDSILSPVDVSSGVSADKYGYALWAPDSGAFPMYYPYVSLVRYEPPYMDDSTEYDTVLGGFSEGSGDGKATSEYINGLAVWDGNGEGDLRIFVTEGSPTEEVEIFSADFLTSPGGLFTPIATLSGLPGTPLDVAILPVGDAGVEDENWFCILTESRTVEFYTFSGQFVESVYDIEALPLPVLHLDADLANLRIHVIMQGPEVTVIQYTSPD